MYLKSTVFALPLITMGSVATAQSVEFLSYGAGYTSVSGSGFDADLFSLGGAIDYRNNDFVFNGNISFVDADFDELTLLGLRGGYFVTPDLALYAGLDYFDALGFDATLYNLGGEYKFGDVTVGLGYQDSDDSGIESATTIYGSYQVSPELEVALGFTEVDNDVVTVLGADYDMGDTELFATFTEDDGFNTFAVSGNYDFGNNFRAGGGYVNFDGDVDIISISGGYEVAESLWVDLSVGNIDSDFGDDIDIIGLSISFETGRETLLIDRAETAQSEALGLIGNILASF